MTTKEKIEVMQAFAYGKTIEMCAVGDLIIDIAGRPLHISAQSMKGFYRYVYKREDGGFFICHPSNR